MITTTEVHPFWVEGKGWTRAGDMHVGDVLETPDGAVVLDEMVVVDLEKVYNFRVTIDHNYFALAGETPVLVHNADYSFVPRTEKAGDLSKYTEGQKTRDGSPTTSSWTTTSSWRRSTVC